MKPINPVFPHFTALCSVCGGRVDSMSGAAGDLPFTYVCHIHLDQATREAVWRNTNEQVRRFTREQPAWVAHARRVLGIRRPRNVPPDPSWEGCQLEL